ncbi:MFS transporter [Marinobacter halodurans]|uniref:MFS transporter n=1 Tax=Marinobacter halodurans TaxID=2528979 RepID=A0ABY1ZI08_9GAMM|nr:MFS transporter [Marinobacter halodurans]TBW53777.1 MFS transporter [Marinobacter halodurans]
MTRMVASLSALILSTMLLVSGNAFLMTLLGIRLGLESIDPGTIGRVLACYSIGFVIGTLSVNRVIERVGHIRAFAVFSAMTAVTALLYPVALSMTFWAVLRVLSGFSMAGVLLVVESWFSSRATNSNRGTLFAVYQIVFFISVAAGQLIVNLGDPASFLLYTIAAILLTLSLIPLSLTRMEAPAIGQVARISIFAMLRQSTTGVLGALICGVLIGTFYALGPVYATLIGLNLAQTSIFMATAIIAAMLLAWPMGRVCDRFDRRRVMLTLSIVAALAACAAAFLGVDHPVLLIAAVGAFTGLSAALYPIAVAITNDRMEQSHIVAASATLLLSYGLGSVLGPLVISELISLTGPGGLFLGSAGFLVLLAGITGWYIWTTEDIPVEQQEHFVSTMPEAMPVLTEMDPRNETFQTSPEAAEIAEESATEPSA